MKTIPLAEQSTSTASAAPAEPNVARIVADPARTEALRPAIVEAISTVYDPEIPVNIWELGLIYDVAVDASGVAHITMTLTAPGCPLHETMAEWARAAVAAIPGVERVDVAITFDPPWTPARMRR